MVRRRLPAALFATLVAALGWTALLLELSRSLTQSLGGGRDLPHALFAYFRFFTILTNWGIAALMSVTSLALWRGKVLPSASNFLAALVYLVVTCLTYELLLRRSWSPSGLQFWTDMVFHDVQPALMLLFWIGFAPRRDLGWRDLPWIFAYPAAYFAVTLVAGALGAGYPYDFLDAAKLGYPVVIGIGFAFLAVFFILGALATAVAHTIMDDRLAEA